MRLLLAALLLATLPACIPVPWVRMQARDEFPVFDHPDMVPAEEAETEGYVREKDAVIGVALNGEAKCYPVRIMGLHELGNDSCGGEPIAVTW